MKATIKDLMTKVQVLVEDYNEYYKESGQDIQEVIRLSAESDSSFYRWITGNEDVEDFGENLENRDELLDTLCNHYLVKEC